MMNAPSDLRGLAAREATDDTPLRIMGIPVVVRDDLSENCASTPPERDRLIAECDELRKERDAALKTVEELDGYREGAWRRADELQSSLTDMAARFDNAAAQLKEATDALRLSSHTNRVLNDDADHFRRESVKSYENGYQDALEAAFKAGSHVIVAEYKIVPTDEDA